MGGPHTVVKNPSPDKKSWSENTGLDLDLDLDLTLTLLFLECFIISLYVITHNKKNQIKTTHFMYLLRAKITPMNAYGSVSRVSESIYKLLRYMNWVSKDNKNGNPDNNNDYPEPMT
jgi:hypothetical protein